MKKQMQKTLAAIFLFVAIGVTTAKAQDNDALIKVCLAGDLAGVKQLVEAGANVNATDSKGEGPLLSCWFWPEITQYLIDKGAKPNDGDIPAVVRAAQYYSIDVMKILLKAGADPNKPIGINPTAMYKKALEDEKAKGKDANKSTIKTYESIIRTATITYMTTLNYFVMVSNCKECAELLINAGAKTDLIDTYGRNLLHQTALIWMDITKRVANKEKGVPVLENLGIKVPDWYKNLDPSKYGSAGDMIALFKSKGVDILLLDKGGVSPIQVPLAGAQLGGAISSEMLLGMIDNGANVLLDDKRRGTIFVQAAAFGSPEVMAAILAKGADINHEDDVRDGTGESAEEWKGYTALINSVKWNNLPTVKYLIEHGAKLTDGVNGIGTIYSYKSNTKCTGYKVKNKSVIFFAIETGNMELVKYLIESKNLSWKNVDNLKYEEQKGKTHDTWVNAGSKCFPSGSFNGPDYAKRIGNLEMQKYLKDTNMGVGFYR